MISSNQCAAAVAKARRKHTVRIDGGLALLVLTRVESYLATHTFVEAMRFALNDALISDQEVRAAYASVIGFYFSPHGASVRRRNVRKKEVIRKKQPRNEGATDFFTEPSGQIAWKI